jgi:Flp pilus assembly protein TadD
MLGTVLQRLGRHGEAAEAFRAALAAAPVNGGAWAGLGISLEALGRRPEAVEAFKRSLAAASPGSSLAGFAEQRLRALR